MANKRTTAALSRVRHAFAEREQLADDGVAWWADLEPIQEAIDDAVEAGATIDQITGVVGGHLRLKLFGRNLRASRNR